MSSSAPTSPRAGRGTPSATGIHGRTASVPSCASMRAPPPSSSGSIRIPFSGLLQQGPAGGSAGNALLGDAAVPGELLQVRVDGLARHRVELLGHVGVDDLNHLGDGTGAVAEGV